MTIERVASPLGPTHRAGLVWQLMRQCPPIVDGLVPRRIRWRVVGICIVIETDITATLTARASTTP
jgi:hypothetical protein